MEQWEKTMSLALVIKQHGSTYAAAQNKYKESVIAVNTQMAAVLSSKLPPVIPRPPEWDKYRTAYLQAQTVALGWVNNVMARLLSVPDDVQNYNTVVVSALEDAIVQADKLIKNPNDGPARAALDADLKTILRALNLVTVFISEAVKSIQKFKNDLPDLAKQLQSIADLAVKDSDANKGQIDELKKDIAAYQAEVDRLVGAMVALGLTAAAAIALATIATFVAWPIGAVAWIFAAPVIAIAIYYLVIDGIKITTLKAKIGQAVDQMTDLTASVAVLEVLAQQFGDLSTKTVAIEPDLQAVLTEWQAFEGAITRAIKQIQDAISNEKTGDFAKVKTELNEALTEWNGVYQKAGSLHLDLVVKEGIQLLVGMTPTEVKALVDNAPSIDIITYCNRVAA
jgi:hypothetical protein